MKLDDAAIKKILLDGNYLDSEDAKKAEQAAKAYGLPFSQYLIEEELLSKTLLGQAMAEFYKLPFADLNANPPSSEQVRSIPEKIAKEERLVFFSDKKDTVTLATDEPKLPHAASEFKSLFPKKKVAFAFALSEDIETAFLHYQKSLATRFSKILEKQERVAPEILEEIFEDALAFNASDIHFEVRHNDVLVRFRVDGVLQEAGKLPVEYYENILNRIKVHSSLRIDEHFAAQDGSLRYEKNGHSVDMRVSVVPTVEGEKIVLRVLSAYVRGFSLGDLGLTAEHQAQLAEAAHKPFGMVLIVGPTGSGKTTTLYALLKILNSPAVNVTTIEDPVEYKMLGINQIQVNPQTNLTFAKGLRSIVRQDPDIILVGEIRDQETAEIAVNAALTGHLLLSTFHANDAATAMPRLLDMGVEPFLLASTLDVIVAQRLARKICDHCRVSLSKSTAALAKSYPKQVMHYFKGSSVTLYQGKGCDACGHTGYKGRTAVFEIITVTPQMQTLVMRSPSTQEIWKLARTQGSRSMFEDGIAKVKTGVTTLDELLRVAEPENLDS